MTDMGTISGGVEESGGCGDITEANPVSFPIIQLHFLEVSQQTIEEC